MKAELGIRGTSLAKIVRELGVTDGAVTLVGKRKNRSRRIELALALALALDKTPDGLFPDRRDGNSQ